MASERPQRARPRVALPVLSSSSMPSDRSELGQPRLELIPSHPSHSVQSAPTAREAERCERARYRAWRALRIRTPRRRRPRRGRCQPRFWGLSWSSSCWILCGLLGDGDVLPRSIRATHKPDRTIHFAHAYAANRNNRYRIDNGALLFALTAAAYKLMQRMSSPTSAMPMRALADLCTFRIR